MGGVRKLELMPTLVTVGACLGAFVLGVVGVSVWAMWDVAKRIA
jgi:hypothetical protein